ncbi:GlsB/YeaQ/YmgE family stress response membrane protein [Comamonas sp. GB3 AK4-5]|uniref:GlsB/YeaQ/YmgE family stress response membrane protein n=1 Tax=Comamonas sp. GB3 AK4-5 TaxID=3231487 RepID=UPI00351DECB0
MMSLLGTLAVGLVIGLIARALKPGDDSMGWIMTVLLGIAGSFLASYLGAAMGLYLPGQPAGWIASVVGAIALLVLYQLVRSKGP